MSEGYDKSMQILRGFSGKTKEIELEKDDGSMEKIQIYPLPNKYMADLLELQKFTMNLPKKKAVLFGKESEVIDDDSLTSEQRVKLYNMNRNVVALTFAHSLKKQNGKMSEGEFEEIKEMIDDLPATVIQKIIMAISGVNEVPLGQDGVEKK